MDGPSLRLKPAGDERIITTIELHTTEALIVELMNETVIRDALAE